MVQYHTAAVVACTDLPATCTWIKAKAVLVQDGSDLLKQTDQEFAEEVQLKRGLAAAQGAPRGTRGSLQFYRPHSCVSLTNTRACS